ncbi:MAG TPA: hypothetical protein VIQ60_13530 [Gemmatimonadaceae bacterium]
MAISESSADFRQFIPDSERTHTHEAVRAGVLGAVVVWLWILLIGILNGAPLRLASLIGGGLTSVVSGPSAPQWVAVSVFTVFHFVVWLGIAELGVVVLQAAARTPAVLMLAAVVGILLLLAIAGVTTMFGSSGLGAGFAWQAIYAGSMLGLCAMWWYLLRNHPEVRAELAHVDDA